MGCCALHPSPCFLQGIPMAFFYSICALLCSVFWVFAPRFAVWCCILRALLVLLVIPFVVGGTIASHTCPLHGFYHAATVHRVLHTFVECPMCFSVLVGGTCRACDTSCCGEVTATTSSSLIRIISHTFLFFSFWFLVLVMWDFRRVHWFGCCGSWM